MRNVLSMASMVLLASCGTISSSPRILIPAAVVLNTIKCEMARYFADERLRDSSRIRFLEGEKPFVITLTLKVVDTAAGKAGVGIGPLILPYGSASLGFAVSGSKSVTTSMEDTILLNPYSLDTSVCAAARSGAGMMENPGLGIGDRLNEFAEQLLATSAGHPMMLFDKFSMTKQFAVSRSVHANGSFGFQAVRLNLTAEASRTREDVQTIKIIGVTAKPPGFKEP
ncbi:MULTISPECIES: hypothetical protein [Agrobacterium]|uniref:Lipoprotein n=1 Tax=Agrobacterium tumefaciens TaxID=358 RepID=A0AAE6EHL5_AGRTU|nr:MULTISPECIES: hypothetical protein [Agrobacterium]QCL77115.1 hypothetical protein CFBP5499_27120 [Agrobacterium tumefaciens]QCL82624.1 hypothetical protein CFBP5877_26370 [Agrobacterium tumefaciens]CUX70179.1 exported hypothetical protein [Agrobacterium sp. NCPPB 925]